MKTLISLSHITSIFNIQYEVMIEISIWQMEQIFKSSNLKISAYTKNIII